MQINELIHLINNPKEITPSTTQEIALLVKKYSYSTTLQQLLTLGLFKTKDINFSKQLHRSAISCSNREKLFHLLHQETEPKALKTPTNTFTHTPKKSKTTKPPALDAPEENPSNQESIKTPEVQTPIFSPKTILEENTEKKIVTPIIKEDKTPEETTTVSPKKNKEVNSKMSFNNWLGNITTPKSTKKSFQLIDKFIENEPRISKDTPAPKKKIDLAAKSTLPNTTIVSETLAIIYIDQANYEMAIKTYQQLMVKYPKKKSYFASQIDILENKIE